VYKGPLVFPWVELGVSQSQGVLFLSFLREVGLSLIPYDHLLLFFIFSASVF